MADERVELDITINLLLHLTELFSLLPAHEEAVCDATVLGGNDEYICFPESVIQPVQRPSDLWFLHHIPSL